MLNVFQKYITDGNGNAINGASVEVREPGTTTKVNIFEDEDGNTQYTSNVATTDAGGYVELYVAGGKYDVFADDGAGNTVTFSNVQLGTAQGKDVIADGGTVAEQADLDAATTKFIAEPFPLLDDITGVNAPDNSGVLKFIKLTAGLTGAGEYNEGLLINESVSGTPPLVVATAEINDPDSPMNGQTVPLINTENRYLMPGESPGTIANDQMQQITGSITGGDIASRRAPTSAGALTWTGTGNAAVGGTADHQGEFSFDSADSPDARTGDHTNVKHLQVTYYMRIR